jgi:hypothetical protein
MGRLALSKCRPATGGQSLVADQPRADKLWLATSGRPPATGRHLDNVILFKFFYFLKLFEACPYTWKCKILHFPWRLEISLFFNLEYT